MIKSTRDMIASLKRIGQTKAACSGHGVSSAFGQAADIDPKKTRDDFVATKECDQHNTKRCDRAAGSIKPAQSAI